MIRTSHLRICAGPLIVLDREGRSVFTNHRAVAMFGDVMGRDPATSHYAGGCERGAIRQSDFHAVGS